MAKSKITITGEAKKAPKINDDGTVDLIFKIDMSEAVPKGLNPLGETNYMVHVAKKTWSKVADNASENSFYIINGEPKARITVKGAPFIEVVCFDIALKETIENKEKPVEKPKAVLKEQTKEDKPIKVEKSAKQEQPKQDRAKKKHDKGQYVPENWYDPSEVISIKTNDLILVEEEHLKMKFLDLFGIMSRLNDIEELNFILAVRPIENGKYALVMGMKGYILSKLLSKETVKAVIRDCTYDELMAGFEKQLQEENNKA